MKRRLNICFVVLLLTLLSLSVVYALAEESKEVFRRNLESSINTEMGSTDVVVKFVESIDDVVFDTEEESRFFYVFDSFQPLRAICYECGSPNMGLGSGVSNSMNQPHTCPTSPMGWDIFKTYDHYSFEYCAACGYVSDSWVSYRTYAAECRTGNTPSDGEDWEVRYEYTQANGYDLHQSLRYWLYESEE